LWRAGWVSNRKKRDHSNRRVERISLFLFMLYSQLVKSRLTIRSKCRRLGVNWTQQPKHNRISKKTCSQLISLSIPYIYFLGFSEVVATSYRYNKENEQEKKGVLNLPGVCVYCTTTSITHTTGGQPPSDIYIQPTQNSVYIYRKLPPDIQKYLYTNENNNISHYTQKLIDKRAYFKG
jgi:hypothetical protein